MAPEARVAAVDISAEALAVAAANVERHAPGRVALARGDLLQPFAPGFDLILANLPYIADGEWTALSVGVKSYEPSLALRGGVNGLEVIRRLLPQAARKLRAGGMALLEIGWRQGEAAAALARDAFPRAEVTVRPDFAGNDRVVVIQT
jgi:release factor glutamine methyltransferase